eukprot:EG_transcript_34642
MACPPQLKVCLPYLQRHQELAKRDPAVAHYCKYYAVRVGYDALKKGDEEGTRFLTTLMDELEREKGAVAHLSDDQGQALVHNYALLLFGKADERERQGIGDKVTMQLFFAASVLMEVAKQFGELQPVLAEKQTYAKWKVTQIKKAVDQGIPYVRDEDPVFSDASPAPPADSAPPFPPPPASPSGPLP